MIIYVMIRLQCIMCCTVPSAICTHSTICEGTPREPRVGLLTLLYVMHYSACHITYIHMYYDHIYDD